MATMKKTSIAIAAGAVMTAGLAVTPSIASAENPFSATELPSGYMQLAKHHSGEAKCGGDKKMDEGRCGHKKMDEGKCGHKKMDEAGDDGHKKMDEGKCGEAKCGGSK